MFIDQSSKMLNQSSAAGGSEVSSPSQISRNSKLIDLAIQSISNRRSPDGANSAHNILSSLGMTDPAVNALRDLYTERSKLDPIDRDPNQLDESIDKAVASLEKLRARAEPLEIRPTMRAEKAV